MSRAIVMGLGVSGRAAARYLLASGTKVLGVDRDSTVLEHLLKENGLEFAHEQDPISFLKDDFVVLSPGIPLSHPTVLLAKEKGIEVIGEIELACRHLKNPMIGITGTNGKTTVTLLVTHVLNQCGIVAKAVGNVGTSLISHPQHDSSSVLIVELSSFQLETLESKAFDAAVILNITPDHLDRYTSLKEYANAKIRLQECIKRDGKFWVYEPAYQEYQSQFSSIPFIYSSKEISGVKNEDVGELLSNFSHRGHDLENLMASYAIVQTYGVTAKQFIQAQTSFKKPSHRIEYIRTKDGVAFYDDSKGTNRDAVVRAVESIPGKIVLIAGGVDKGASYAPWRDAFKDKVKFICAIGEAAFKIYKELSPFIPVQIFENLDKATTFAAGLSQLGESVLLSPGCSSYDMFRDYAHRGDEFQRIVRNL